MTDKHLKYFFKQPQKQMQLMKTQQVGVIMIITLVLVRIIMIIIALVRTLMIILMLVGIIMIMFMLVRIIMKRMKMLLMITLVSQCCPAIDKVTSKVRRLKL